MEKANFIVMFMMVIAICLGAVVLAKKLLMESQVAVASPVPSVDTLLFSNQQNTPAQSAQPQPSGLPLEKIKKLDKFPGILKPEELQNKVAEIQTAKGKIDFQIYPEATKAASNFLILASNGFYDNLTFHRVEDWVVQGGDPEGTGRGGPGYQFADEPVTRAYEKGIVAMANAGPNTNGSQFFILKKDYPLDPNYTIFGKVIQGLDVVDKLMVGDTMQKVVIGTLKQ
ncbi:MAG: peptidylprolyl isomerase [Candidatus Daviesbacteria bacterium]|nr:peptidylprolyl isomerase [Candidatus Daviesbacteria bacterium]